MNDDSLKSIKEVMLLLCKSPKLSSLQDNNIYFYTSKSIEDAGIKEITIVCEEGDIIIPLSISRQSGEILYLKDFRIIYNSWIDKVKEILSRLMYILFYYKE